MKVSKHDKNILEYLGAGGKIYHMPDTPHPHGFTPVFRQDGKNVFTAPIERLLKKNLIRKTNIKPVPEDGDYKYWEYEITPIETTSTLT